MKTLLTQEFEASRKKLKAYLCRFVLRPHLAEDLVQETYIRCFQASERLPDTSEGVRAWIFKVATNLGIDELRRHSNWREHLMFEIRNLGESKAEFVQQSRELINSPETKSIAREHIIACLACSLKNLSEQKAAAFLLREIHGFKIEEVAEILDASVGQVKYWVKESRTFMEERYGKTCALISKNGMCHQCDELDGFFQIKQGNPFLLVEGEKTIEFEHLLEISKSLEDVPWGRWHTLMFELLDEILMC